MADDITTKQGIFYVLVTFFYVLFAGFQSRSVNAGNYLYAICGSIGISAMQLITVKIIAFGDPFVVFILTVAGAVPGICLAIYLAQRIDLYQK